jgi:hypothetical protein
VDLPFQELHNLLQSLPEESVQRIGAAVFKQDDHSLWWRLTLWRLMTYHDVESFICAFYCAFVTELRPLVEVEYSPSRARTLADSFLENLLLGGAIDFPSVLKQDGSPKRSSNLKKIKSKAFRSDEALEFRDELRDCELRKLQSQISAITGGSVGNVPELPAPSIEPNPEASAVLKRPPSPKWKPERWAIIENYLLEVVRAGKPEPSRTSVFELTGLDSSDCYAWLRGEHKPSVERAIFRICVEEKPHLK